MTKTEIAKKIIHFTVLIGSGNIIKEVIKNNTQPDTVIDTVTYTAAGYALGGLVATEASRYTDRKVDDVIDWWNKNVTAN